MLLFLIQVDEADPSFPRPVSYWWFGCKSQPKGRIPKTNTFFGGGRGFGDGIDVITDVATRLPDVVVTSVPDVEEKTTKKPGWKSYLLNKFLKKVKKIFTLSQ